MLGSDVMRKYMNTDNGFIEIEDYGVVDYLLKNDNERLYKLMACIYDSEYAVNYAPAAECNHSDLTLQILKEFGNEYTACIGAFGNKFDFHKLEFINNESIDVINSVLEDIKYYNRVYNKDVIIQMHNFEFIDEEREFNCEEIDQVINLLNDNKNVRTRN